MPLLINHYLPHYDVHARYEIDIRAPLPRVYEAAQSLDLRGSWIARRLFRLRGLPEANLTLKGMMDWGFFKLADEPERRYWFLIGPFSGLIRREWLRLIKTQAEKQVGVP